MILRKILTQFRKTVKKVNITDEQWKNLVKGIEKDKKSKKTKHFHAKLIKYVQKKKKKIQEMNENNKK